MELFSVCGNDNDNSPRGQDVAIFPWTPQLNDAHPPYLKGFRVM